MKKIIFFIFIICLLFPKVVLAKDEIDINITPGARSAIMMEASTGEILYNKNANKPCSVASLTKMMGLIIIFETIEKGGLSLDEIITVSENAKNMGGTQLWLDTGEKISVRDLIKGITMASANDAMVAMAERVAGTEDAFVQMMNNKVKEYGLKNTNFKNVTGLDQEGHYSSCYDMAIIARELIKHEEVLEFTKTYEDYIREGTTNKTWISNTNKLVRFYKGADGLKTGYEDKAGSCIAATAKRDNLRFIVILLGYDKVNNRNKEAMDLLDYGFNQYKADLIYKKGSVVSKIKIDKASTEVSLITKEDIINLRKKVDKEKNYKYLIDLKDVKLPIEKDYNIGNLLIKDKDKIIRKIPLYVKDEIKKIGFFKFYLNTIKGVLLGEN